LKLTFPVAVSTPDGHVQLCFLELNDFCHLAVL
jgi:hypothetical protein